MPRAFLKTKNKAGHHVYKCNECGKRIEPGEMYYTWKFNRGMRYFRHHAHGAPPRGQLTNSKMAEVYNVVDDFDVSDCNNVEDIQSRLQDVAGVAQEVASEYEMAADSIESAFPNGNATSEACRATSDKLVQWADSLESWEPDTDFDASEYTPDTVADAMADWIEDCRNAAHELVNEHPEYQG